jgi:putative hydrolase of the HAD superfamily
MSLILAFDLDDTLYPEGTYVESGMRAVAKMLSKNFTLDYRETQMRLLEILEREGRGKIFNTFLEEKRLFSKKILSNCLTVYRNHSPNISLDPDAIEVISKFRGKKYLVTDGHKIVQQSKIDALKIKGFFEKTYLTNRYGIVNAKPSLHCFKRILERENADWRDLIYVGDNPAKDFVNLNLMGSMTVRIMTGRHQFDSCPSGYDAKFKIKKLGELKTVLKGCYE